LYTRCTNDELRRYFNDREGTMMGLIWGAAMRLAFVLALIVAAVA
jgi:hypothetical protein